MIDVETSGFDEAREKLEWLVERRGDIGRYVAARMAEMYREELDLDGDHVHLIRVDARRRTLYGVSIEPTPEEVAVEELLDRDVLLFLSLSKSDLVEGDEASSAAGREVAAAADHGAWAPEFLPVSPPREVGVWVAREASFDEMEAAREENAEFLDRTGLSTLSTDTPVLVEPDVAYNAVRAEFGFGDVDSSESWRPAMRTLIEERLPSILDEAAQAIATSEIDERALPNFEERSVDWWRARSGFMDFIWGQEAS